MVFYDLYTFNKIKKCNEFNDKLTNYSVYDMTAYFYLLLIYSIVNSIFCLHIVDPNIIKYFRKIYIFFIIMLQVLTFQSTLQYKNSHSKLISTITHCQMVRLELFSFKMKMIITKYMYVETFVFCIFNTEELCMAQYHFTGLSYTDILHLLNS